MVLDNSPETLHGPDVSLQQRRAVDGDAVAELADFLVAADEDGFVLAQFGFAGDEQGAVVHVGRVGVAGQAFEVGIAAALRCKKQLLSSASCAPSAERPVQYS